VIQRRAGDVAIIVQDEAHALPESGGETVIS
jgi:hypothetical protein